MTSTHALPHKSRRWSSKDTPTVVKRDEFCRMLLSFRKYVRSDEPRYRGLMEVETGRRFVIETEELLKR